MKSVRARAARDAAARAAADADDEGKIRDENGNTIGSWRFEESEGKR